MALMQITFSGNTDEFEYDIDIENNTIMFHDKKTSTIFLGKGTMEAESRHDTLTGPLCGTKSPVVDITISLQPYSIFKYNDSHFNGRFVVYWNERDTVIWDKKSKKQVPNKNIWDYLHSETEE